MSKRECQGYDLSPVFNAHILCFLVSIGINYVNHDYDNESDSDNESIGNLISDFGFGIYDFPSLGEGPGLSTFASK